MAKGRFIYIDIEALPLYSLAYLLPVINSLGKYIAGTARHPWL